MKRRLILILSLILLVTCFVFTAVALEADDGFLGVGEGISALDNSRVIFIGQAYTYSGNVIEKTGNSHVTQSVRTKNDGYFYRICKANGVKNISITDWAFSGHTVSSLFSGETCKASGHTSGTNHLNDLTDKYYDYVVIQESNEGYETAEEYYTLIKGVMDIFREANPNVKIYYILHNVVYTSYSSEWRRSVELIEDEGATIVDWGSLVVDVYSGNVAVPGATLSYNRNSFCVSQSSSSRSNPNLVSGYLYSLMTYCAITGETPVGQPWAFAKTYTGDYSLSSYTTDYYKYDDPDTADVDESVTNMTAIFNSDADMTGLQTLAAEYLTKKNWESYTVTFKDDEGNVISSATYQANSTVTIPEPPEKTGSENYTYRFVGWDSEVSEKAVADATYTAVYERVLLKDWGAFAPGSNSSELNNKKILFTGCSYTYYGGIVERSASDAFSQATRTSGETGFFKRLCAENGVDSVTVTDWVFGGHDLTDIFDGYCDAGSHDGHDHLADLTDRNYDYVILQEILVPGFNSAEQYAENVAKILEIFREGNPDTKFYFMLHNQVYLQTTYGNEWKKSIQLIADMGVTVIDWGAVVYDVIKGNVEVPGATLDYNKQSFIVSSSSSDGYHPNLVSGYLGTIATYAALTGESPVGQPYEWIYPLTSKYLNIDKFISSYYTYDNPNTADVDESTTNMKEIFYSPSDMLGLQTLLSEYMTKTRWLDIAEWTVEFVDSDGTVISTTKYKWGDEITLPTSPSKDSDVAYTYEFVGWDKAVATVCGGDTTYTATYQATPIEYTVTFFDADGTELSSAIYHYGDTVTAPEVLGYEDDEYRYVFSGWDKTVSACLGDTTYTAQYTKTEKGYIVSFRDYDGTLISAETCQLGDTVTVPADPTREADNTYTYTFSGWDKDIVACEGDTTYTATYTATYIEYTVSFVDEDGTLISENTYHYGDEVSVPTAPEKAQDNEYTYTFSGWDSEVTACLGNATYTATYEATLRIYSVVFANYDGEVILNKTYHWGDEITIPDAPERAADEAYTYEFVGWDRPVVNCEGTTTYTAVYKAYYITRYAVVKDIFVGADTEDTSDDRYKVIFLAGVDSLDYKKAGFKITVITSDGTSTTKMISTTTVYTDYTVGETTCYASEFGSACEYIIALSIVFPATEEYRGATLVIQSVTEDYDGNMEYGEERTYTGGIYTAEEEVGE